MAFQVAPFLRRRLIRVERDSVSQRRIRIGSNSRAASQKSVVMVSPVNEGAGCIGEIRLTSSWPHEQLLPWIDGFGLYF